MAVRDILVAEERSTLGTLVRRSTSRLKVHMQKCNCQVELKLMRGKNPYYVYP